MTKTLKPHIDYEPAESIWEIGTEYKPGQVFDDGEEQFEIGSVGPNGIETVDGCTIPLAAIAQYEYLGVAYGDDLVGADVQEGVPIQVSDKGTIVPTDSVELPASGSIWVDSEGEEVEVDSVQDFFGHPGVVTEDGQQICLYDFLEEYELVASPPPYSEIVCPEEDVVNNPSHYLLFPEHNLEVKDISKRVLDNLDNSDMNMSSYEAGCFKEAVQYLLRCYGKGQWQDIEKSVAVLQFAIDSYKERSIEDS